MENLVTQKDLPGFRNLEGLLEREGEEDTGLTGTAGR